LSTLDYTAMGLSVADQQYLQSTTYSNFLSLRDQVNQLKQEYLTLQVNINTDQKMLNEIQRALNAFTALPILILNILI